MHTGQEEIMLAVHVTPGAKRNSVQAFKDGVWQIKIAAPPVEGRANDELMAYLSHLLDVRRSSLSIVKGRTNRNKLVSVAGLSQEHILRRLSAGLKV